MLTAENAEAVLAGTDTHLMVKCARCSVQLEGTFVWCTLNPETESVQQVAALVSSNPTWQAKCAKVPQNVVRDPVVCDDGFSYERAAVEEWLLSHDTSFVTGEALATKSMTPNRALKTRFSDLGLVR